MPRGTNQKLKMLFLLKIMMEKTDDTHYLTMPEILCELEKYDVTAERKSIYTDLEDLEHFGVIVEREQIGKKSCYHVVERPFELAELKLLVDSIQSSKFLTLHKSDTLIKKLENFCSIYERNQLQRQVYVQNRIKTMNETVYYSVDTINEAISDGKKIRFKYFNWNVKKEMEFRRGGHFYEISPWALSWDDENYYLIGYDSEDKIIKHYRVDKMKNISLIDEVRDGKECFDGFDTADYSKKNFDMFGGDDERVVLEISNDMAGVIIDRFGKDVSFIPKGKDKSTVTLKVAFSIHFITWVWSLGEKVKIVGPKNVVKRVNDEIARIAAQYSEEK